MVGRGEAAESQGTVKKERNKVHQQSLRLCNLTVGRPKMYFGLRPNLWHTFWSKIAAMRQLRTETWCERERSKLHQQNLWLSYIHCTSSSGSL